MRKAIIALLILLLAASQAEAYYIPAEHMDEAKQVKGTVGWYEFGMKYNDQHWGMDILRQMAMLETNSGKIEELHIVIRKYMK